MRAPSFCGSACGAALWPASGIIADFAAAALFDLFTDPAGAGCTRIVLALTLFALALAPLRELCAFSPCRAGGRRAQRRTRQHARPSSRSRKATTRSAPGAGDAWAEELWRCPYEAAPAPASARCVCMRRHRACGRAILMRLRFVVLALLSAAFVVAGTDWSNRLIAALAPRTIRGRSSFPTARCTGSTLLPIQAKRRSISTHTPTEHSPFLQARELRAARACSASHTPARSLDPEPAAIRGPSRQGRRIRPNGARRRNEPPSRVRARTTCSARWHIKDRPRPAARDRVCRAAQQDRAQNALKLSFTASDDYGVVSARAIITPVGRRAETALVSICRLPIRLPKRCRKLSYRDLTDILTRDLWWTSCSKPATAQAIPDAASLRDSNCPPGSSPIRWRAR